MCFVDLRKAFDRVNYWKLFTQLLDESSDVGFVKLLAFWYSRQTISVYWQRLYSDKFTIWQRYPTGGVLSPHLFTRYVRPLIKPISQSNVGCNIGGLFVNICLLAYADDMVLLTLSLYAMQILIES